MGSSAVRGGGSPTSPRPSPPPTAERGIFRRLSGCEICACPSAFAGMTIPPSRRFAFEPIFECGFIFDSYANRLGKGSHAAVARYEKFRDHSAHVLRGDIFRYFPAIDHAILKRDLRRRIACERTLWLADAIIDRPPIAFILKLPISYLNRHSPDSAGLWGQDRAFARLRQDKRLHRMRSRRSKR